MRVFLRATLESRRGNPFKLANADGAENEEKLFR